MSDEFDQAFADFLTDEECDFHTMQVIDDACMTWWQPTQDRSK